MKMPRIELQPDLDHCIETLARNEYERGLRSILAGESDEYLAERTEVLRLLLETADFKDLRQESERYLLQGRKVTLTVYVDEGAVRYKLQVS